MDTPFDKRKGLARPEKDYREVANVQALIWTGLHNIFPESGSTMT
jgi:hypothetical protein